MDTDAAEMRAVTARGRAGFPYRRHYGNVTQAMGSSGARPAGYDDRGEGPATVLLHPFPFSRTIWAGIADALAARRRVIAGDARGFGESPVAGPFSIAELILRLRSGGRRGFR